MSINWIGLQTFILEELGRVRRVWIQTLIAPWISALLYILVFEQIVGRRLAASETARSFDLLLNSC